MNDVVVGGGFILSFEVRAKANLQTRDIRRASGKHKGFLLPQALLFVDVCIAVISHIIPGCAVGRPLRLEMIMGPKVFLDLVPIAERHIVVAERRSAGRQIIRSVSGVALCPCGSHAGVRVATDFAPLLVGNAGPTDETARCFKPIGKDGVSSCGGNGICKNARNSERNNKKHDLQKSRVSRQNLCNHKYGWPCRTISNNYCQ